MLVNAGIKWYIISNIILYDFNEYLMNKFKEKGKIVLFKFFVIVLMFISKISVDPVTKGFNKNN